MKKLKKLIALLLTLVTVIGVMPLSVTAEETVSVTLKFDASVVCDDISKLYEDLLMSGIVDDTYTPLPDDINLNVKKGASVKEIITKAHEENNFAITGLNENFITNIGFVGNNVLENLVSIPLGDYFSSNIFSMAGWMVLVDNESSMSGIDSTFINNDAVITCKYNLCTVWVNEATYYDDIFLKNYKALKELISADVNLDDFSDEEKANLNKVKEEAQSLILSIENEAKLNDDISLFYKEINPEFNTDKGMWIGFYENKGISLWGTDSVIEKLSKKAEELEKCINRPQLPSYSNELSSLVITTLMGTKEENLIAFSKDKKEYEIYNYSDNLLSNFIKLYIEPEVDSETVEVLLNDTPVSLEDLGEGFKKLSNIDWENNEINTLTIKVIPALESNLENSEYKVKIYKGDKEQDTPNIKELEEEKKDRIEALVNNIASSYVNKTTFWEVHGMGEYLKLYPQTENKLSSDSIKAFVDSAINQISLNEGETKVTLPVLALAKMGKDSNRLYNKNNELVNGIEKLNGYTHSESPWSAPYTLAVYSREEYFNKEKAEALINKLLDSQKEDGCWDSFGTIDTTANAILGLSLYKDYEDEALKEKINASIDKGILYLKDNQNNDGTYSDAMSGKNSNSTAMVAMALSSVGIDMVNDQRFIKDNNTVIDGLLSFVTTDNKGIGFLDNSSISDYSNEQGFRAFISILNVVNTKNPYNTYDIRGITLEPAYEIKNEGGGGVIVPPSEEDDEIEVTLSVKTHENIYWLQNYKVKIPKDDPTVSAASIKALSDNNIKQVGAAGGYISEMTYNGKTLKSAGIGANSGWMYMVNNVTPQVGILDYKLKANDKIVWYYTADYTSHGHSWSSKDDKEEEKKEEAKEEIIKTYSDTSNHWAEKSISKMSKLGYMKGTSDSDFSPDDKLTRGMFVTILHRLANEPKSSKSDFLDIKESDYYFSAVNWANENNIVSGVYDKAFAPGREITREEMAVIIYRYHKYLNFDTDSKDILNIYNDKITVSSWAKEALTWANGVGLITGKGNNLICPDDTATRAETAEIFVRYIEKYLEGK